MDTPRVSVLLPVYNGARYLREALGSIQAQTLTAFECIIVDDGSTDDSQAIAETFAKSDSRFKVHSRPNTGIVGALNDGIELCTAKYIARMDADDVSHPDRLTAQADFLDAHEAVIAVGSWVRMVDPEGEPLWHYRTPQSDNAIRAALKAGNGGALVHPSIMVRAEALRAVGAYHDDWRHIEDFDLYWRLSKLGELANLPERLLDYRQHPDSANVTRAREQQLLLQKRLALEGIDYAVKDVAVSQAELLKTWARWCLDSRNYKGYRKHAKALRQLPESQTQRHDLKSCLWRHIRHRLCHPFS